MSARRLVFAGAVALAATVAAAFALRTDASRDMTRVSNAGKTVRDVRGVSARTANVRSGSLLAVRGKRALYHLEGSGGAPCYGVGPAGDVGNVDAVTCTRAAFPTAVHPVLDFSVYEATQRDVRELALFRVEGIAADGVAAVEFLRPNGDVALSVPVKDNVYATTSVPRGPVKGLAAVDKGGKRLWRSP